MKARAGILALSLLAMTGFISSSALAAQGASTPVDVNPERASGADPVDWALIPTDAKALKALNEEQERMLRRAAASCDASTRGSGNSMNPCATIRVDNEIRQYGSPELKAFHFGMLRNDRYNAFRTPAALQTLMIRRNRALGITGPLPNVIPRYK